MTTTSHLKHVEFKVSEVHDYTLKPSKDSLGLKAEITGTSFNTNASTLDHFIWDEVVNKGTARWCETITVWTKDIEFNLILFGKHVGETTGMRCAYFPAPDEETTRKHEEYREAIFKVPVPSIPLDELVAWNSYTISKKHKRGSAVWKRVHCCAQDCTRPIFKSIPLPTNFIGDRSVAYDDDAHAENAMSLYEAILNRYVMVTGVGGPMQRNLLGLSSLLADSSVRVALVTGEPGTGKESYCRALYYGNKITQAGTADEPESVFLQTTALEIEQYTTTTGTSGAEYLKAQIERAKSTKYGTGGTGPGSVARSPVLFIDELNKASKKLLASLLRPLEQGDSELGIVGKPKFILAASEHIDVLAKKPPQDFWTRISHQLRVAHPLSRVSEDDGETFLRALFYDAWWTSISEMLETVDDARRGMFEKILFGDVNKVGPSTTFNPSSLCDVIMAEFVNTLVPLVSRDTLSIRGVRSILLQVFARLSWFIRYERPNIDLTTNEDRNAVIRQVNTAIQDVLAILNAARSTPPNVD